MASPATTTSRTTTGTWHTSDVQGVVIRRDDDLHYTAQSQSDFLKDYTLARRYDGKWSCTCPGYEYRGSCKHAAAVTADSVAYQVAAGPARSKVELHEWDGEPDFLTPREREARYVALFREGYIS